MRGPGRPILIVVGLGTALAAFLSWSRAQQPPDGTWTADTELVVERAMTDLGLGAVQGVAVRDGKVYAYGDLVMNRPRVGTIKEYTLNLEPTGREVRLTSNGQPRIIHPTGLSWDPRWGTVLGDTVEKKGIIYRLDWARAWADGNLDEAILQVIEDDAAMNGSRPLFVEFEGRPLLATADYGDQTPELRLYDPESLFAAGRSGATGVIVHRARIGPFNQNLAWDPATGRLTCVQNVIAGRGWRLDVLDLAKLTAGGSLETPGSRVQCLTFSPHDELEGYCPLDRTRALFAVARRRDNVLIGMPQSIEPRLSAPE